MIQQPSRARRFAGWIIPFAIAGAFFPLPFAIMASFRDPWIHGDRALINIFSFFSPVVGDLRGYPATSVVAKIIMLSSMSVYNSIQYCIVGMVVGSVRLCGKKISA